MKRNDIGDSYVLGCSSGSLRRGECIHPNAALCWQALIQLMRERATSLDAILPVLREKRIERAIARGLVKALARRARRAASERRRASDRASASKSIGGRGRENQGAGKARSAWTHTTRSGCTALPPARREREHRFWRYDD